MNKKMKKRLLVALPMALALASPAFLAASCVKTAAQKREFKEEYNAPYSATAFPVDTSITYGQFIGNYANVTGTALVRIQGMNTPEIKIDKDNNKYVAKPTFTRNKLEAAAAVILTLEDGTVKVYDNDEAEILPEAKSEATLQKEDGTERVPAYEKITVAAQSANPRSINNIDFESDLKKTTKMQLAIRKNMSYLDAFGKKTKYTVQPKDFYYSWLRTNAIDNNTRHKKLGGNSALDKLAHKYMPKNTRAFTDDWQYSNNYVLGIYNLDYNKFFNENDFLTNLDATSKATLTSNENIDTNAKTVTFTKDSKATQKADFTNFFAQWLQKSATFYGAPSQYIDEQNTKLTNLFEEIYAANESLKTDLRIANDKVVSLIVAIDDNQANVDSSDQKIKTYNYVLDNLENYPKKIEELQAKKDNSDASEADKAKWTDEINKMQAFVDKYGTDEKKAEFEDLLEKSKKLKADNVKQLATNTAELKTAQENLKKLQTTLIKAIRNKKLNFLYKTSGQEPADAATYLFELNKLPEDSLARKIGIYWYGFSEKNTLFAGPYYPTPYKNLRRVYVKNPYYFDEDFVNDKKTLNKLVTQYQQSQVELNIYTDRIFNQYANGSVSVLAYRGLSDSQIKTIQSNPSKYGLRYTQVYNTNTPYYLTVQNPFATAIDDNKKGEDFFKFSDAYSYMMWGVNKNDLGKGKANASQWTSGLGLSFRTILNAALNWYYLSNELSSGQKDAWLAKVAANSLIGGSNQDSSSIKTPFDVSDYINSLFAIDVDGNKINFGDASNPIFTISPQENNTYQLEGAGSDRNLKSQSPYFNKLKEEMQKVMDAFDAKFPDEAGKPIAFNLYYPYTNPDEKMQIVAQNVIDTLQRLNSRIQAKFVYFPNTSSPEFNDYRYQGVNGSFMLGWGYDYDSIGSGYDGLSWGASLIQALSQIYHDKDTSPTLYNNNYPQLVAAANYMVENYAQAHKLFSVEPSEWYKIKPSYLNGKNSEFKSGENNITLKLNSDGLYVANPLPVWFAGTENTDNYKEVISETQPPSDSELGEFKPKLDLLGKQIKANEIDESIAPADFYLWSAKFWHEFVASKTNEELKDFMQEFSSFYGHNLFSMTLKSKDEFTPFLVQKA